MNGYIAEKIKIISDPKFSAEVAFKTAKNAINAKRGALKNSTAIQTLELDMLTTNIRLLQKIQDSDLSPDKKNMATAKFLEATVSDHEFIQKAKNSGVHVAGLTDTFSFFTGLMSIGINIQNMQRHSIPWIKTNGGEHQHLDTILQRFAQHLFEICIDLGILSTPDCCAHFCHNFSIYFFYQLGIGMSGVGVIRNFVDLCANPVA